MRVVVAIKSTGGRGAARAARYVSERDRDPQREGEGPRPLFSEREDKLTYRKADQVLSGGHGTPDKDDLIHLSASFRPEDYERLGGDDRERQARLREVAREALAGLRDDLGAGEWRWVAGIHLNTEHPHLHIVLSKEIADRETGALRRLGRIPKRLLPRRESHSDGATRPVEGGIGGHFVAALDRHIEHARETAEVGGGRGRGAERVTGSANEPRSQTPAPVPEEAKEGSRWPSPATFSKLVPERPTPAQAVNFNDGPLVRVSRRHPCPVCGKPTWCSTSRDGTRAICMRVPSPHATRNGGYLHILSESLDPAYRPGPRLVEVVQMERAGIGQRDVVYRALLDALSLNERDQANLLARGLDKTVIVQNGYRSVPSPAQAAKAVHQLDPRLLAGVPGFYREDGGWRLNLDDWHQGFLIPVRDEAGRLEGFQIRRTQSEPRYVWLSSNNRPEGTSSGAPIHYCNVSRMREQGEAIITEGALKADLVAHYLDRGVISVQGVMSFPADFGQQLRKKIPELGQASIAFDADSERKPEVRRALERLEDTLRQAGLHVVVLRWPERDGKGLDDYLQARLGRDFTHAPQPERSERQLQVLREIGWSPLTRSAARGAEPAPATPDEQRAQAHVSARDETKEAGQWLRVTSAARRATASWNGSADELPIRSEPWPERLLDRLILGEAVVADARREYAVLAYERAIRGGEAFRFHVRDESSGGLRQISELDVKRRAEARGQRAADEGNPQRPHERREIRQRVSAQDLARHAATLQTLRGIRSKVVAKLEKEASAAQREHAPAEDRARAVLQKYQARGEGPPPPLISRDKLIELQDQAIRHGRAERVVNIERLRIVLSEEHNRPARNDAEAARLAAQLFTERTELSARRERATSFDQTRHLRQWEVGKERWSLVDLDRAIARQTDEARFFGKYRFHFDPRRRRRAAEEATRLTAVRAEVVRRIEERGHLLHGEVEQSQKLVEILTRIHQGERDSRAREGRALPEPEFTREELERLAANAETARDAQLLRQAHRYEKQSEWRGLSEELANPERLLRRALAREIVAEVGLRESGERLKHYEERRAIQPLVVAEKDGRMTTHRLKETELHPVIRRMLRPFVEVPADRERREKILAASGEYHQHLLSDFEKSRAYFQTVHELAAEARAELRSRDHAEKTLEPAFTAKERIDLEVYAERQTDAQERERYLRLARGEANERPQSHDGHPPYSFEHSRAEVTALVRSFFTRGAGRGR